MEFLNELNTAQREAVTHVEGPMMVIAGAGSGKTRVLTYRIAHLLGRGVDPFSILALTFTNKAAKEMKERIARVVGQTDARSVWMGTFHSVFARILRIESERINYPRNFTIYDTQDSRSLIKDIIKGLGLDDKVYKPSSVQSRISAAKNNLIDARGYAEQPEVMQEDIQAGRPQLAAIYAAYESRCFRSQVMDFDDLLFKMNVLLRDFPDLLSKYQSKFQYLLVDEYQDTNFAQYLIIKQLAAQHENICVVGDDAQSIYSFRGATIQNILNFQADYDDCTMYKLEQNYRSSRFIVNAANSVIERNQNRIKKEIWTENGDGRKIEVHALYNDAEEGRFVATRIFDVHAQEQANWKDFTVLYRTNAQSRSFEESLRKLNIPYRIYGGLSFYQRKEIKDLIAYFRLTANPQDDEAFKRVINYPTRGIGKTTMDRLTVEATERNMSLWDLVENGSVPPSSVKGSALSKVMGFVDMLKAFGAELSQKTAFELGEFIAKRTGLTHTLYKDKTPEGVARYENIQELLSALQSFTEVQLETEPNVVPTLGDFLLDVALLTDADKDDGDNNKVSLMTVHAAKGLEFPHVHIVGLEDNLFPSQMAVSSKAELEEERRLFYVALTRAEKRVTLSYAKSRFRWGQVTQGDPSRFIDEIDESYLVISSAKSKKPTPFSGGKSFSQSRNEYRSMPRRVGGNDVPSSEKMTAQQALDRVVSRSKPAPKPFSGGPGNASGSEGIGRNLKRIPPSEPVTSPPETQEGARSLEVGMTVAHERFGKGKVTQIEGEAPNVKATVFFPSAGSKQLLLKFAKLEIIGT